MTISIQKKDVANAIQKAARKPYAEYQEWATLRDEWIHGQLAGGVRAMTLTDFAISKNLAVSTVQNKSSKMKWRVLLDERRKANDEVVTKQLTERSERAIEEVATVFVGREATIRHRHAQIGKGLQAKAMQRLAAVKAESLSVKEALAMLQLGLTEERFAMGMEQLYQPPEGDSTAHTEYKNLTQQNEGHKRTQEVALQLLKHLKNKGISDAVILKEVGLDDQSQKPGEPKP